MTLVVVVIVPSLVHLYCIVCLSVLLVAYGSRRRSAASQHLNVNRQMVLLALVTVALS